MAKAVVSDAQVFGWAWPAFGLTAAVSTLAVIPLVRRVSYRKVWRLSALAMAVGVASPVVLPGLAGVLAAALLVGGTFVVVTMAGLQEARRIAGDRAPSLMAAMTAAFAAGQIAGPLVVPVLGGFKAALALAAALLVLSAVLLPKEKKR
jgi:MFS family permease